ncbi:MAG: hypothetical protein GWN99_08020 [Gemmatimonadetes bacterium]|uniref:Uncharacterized protein n=1 Tax=Candidatus Kutchimonas denitrificans TaxID=3056748 RepID=A0AAE5CC65_9BACT|nr:hypothetical protein [Gemmatimonadota bacterium]NIR75363.1 hypothetical protein [Candidatus Kutchimonas denitrificans]NIS01005.1 hypothetical protein [Gemmatimonadota bacterium]NIT66629.1 hypothetical protein [Gemmatimonadota bacterium]NIU53209.1 hypothetical protein [Gemmatimonadota bacterium]
MNSQRILLVHEAGPIRSALASALASAGHDVRIAKEKPKNADEFDAVVYGAGFAAPDDPDPLHIAVQRPVNMEELRRVLRSS